jgi:hypothetical protein
MGAGWPYLPDEIEVTIGSRWIFANVYFVEDEVLTLKRHGACEGDSICYSEDGTDIGSDSTNRLRIRIDPSNPTKVWLYWSPIRTSPSHVFETGAYVGLTGLNPYDFKVFWDTNPSFNNYADSDYFDVTQESSFTPLLKYQGEIFKSMTFINN